MNPTTTAGRSNLAMLADSAVRAVEIDKRSDAMPRTTRQSLIALAAAATALATAGQQQPDDLTDTERALLANLHRELDVLGVRIWHAIEHIRYAQQQGTTPAVRDALREVSDMLSVNALLMPLDTSPEALPQPLASVAISPKKYRG